MRSSSVHRLLLYSNSTNVTAVHKLTTWPVTPDKLRICRTVLGRDIIRKHRLSSIAFRSIHLEEERASILGRGREAGDFTEKTGTTVGQFLALNAAALRVVVMTEHSGRRACVITTHPNDAASTVGCAENIVALASIINSVSKHEILDCN